MSSTKRQHDQSETQTSQPKRKKVDHGTTSLNGGQGQLPPLPIITPNLSRAVFTHSSVAAQDPDAKELANYESLEFLGDAYLELMASEVIFERYNSTSPGKASALREQLVRNDTLYAYSRAYEFHNKLNMALGCDQPRDFKKVYADVFEAYVAAVVKSDSDKHKGYETCKAWMTKLWEPKLKKLNLMMVQDIQSKERLAKTVLVPGVKLDYKEEREPVLHRASGQHEYTVGVYLTGWDLEDFHLGTGVSSSKREAGQQAAHKAIQHPMMDKIKSKRFKWLDGREKAEQARLEQEASTEQKSDDKKSKKLLEIQEV